MAVIGAILGDIAGSFYEFYRPKDLDWKHCELFTKQNFYTDDTVLTLACKLAILKDNLFSEAYTTLAQKYPDESNGGLFKDWLKRGSKEPTNSFGNGSAMRCSFIGEHFSQESDVIKYAIKSAECTHSHPEGIKGAVVTSKCIYMARTGASKNEILQYAVSQYPSNQYQYGIDLALAQYRNNYKWNSLCQDSVPVAIRCFIESENYEDFLRNVLSLDCDADTIGAIGGGIAEEFYKGTGFNDDELLEKYLDTYLLNIANI